MCKEMVDVDDNAFSFLVGRQVTSHFMTLVSIEWHVVNSVSLNFTKSGSEFVGVCVAVLIAQELPKEWIEF